jgi:hypothetical protein
VRDLFHGGYAALAVARLALESGRSDLLSAFRMSEPELPAKRSDEQKLLDQVKARFRFAAESESKQRQLELDDLKFSAGNSDNNWQWPDGILKSRQADTQEGIPAQPCLTINKIEPSLNQIFNQARQAKLAIEVHPKGSKASQETAEVFQGLIRNIEVQSNAQVARQWAFERAVTCGRGAYRIATEYSNDGDDDQDIVLKRILNQAAVYLDPTAQEPDWSDGEWAIITVNLTAEQYKAQYGESKLAAELSAADSLTEFESIGQQYDGWVSANEQGHQTIRIAEYFYVTYEEGEAATGRKIQKRKVNWCIVNAREVLERFEWAGRYIPIVPVIGKEKNVDGERIYDGVTRPAKDAQRSFNYAWSKEVGSVGLTPIAPWVIEEGQLEGYERYWKTANTKPWAYLPYKRTNLGGTPSPPPQRNVVEPAIQAIAMVMHEADQGIKDTTGVPPVSLGNLDPHERSGKAVMALQRQAEVGSSNYLDNLARAITYEGKILVDLIPHIYDTPGRIIRILGTDDEPSSVMLNAPFVMGPKGQPQEPGPAATPQQVKQYDLKAGQYGVTVEVGKSEANQQDAANDGMTALISAAPQLAPLIADLWVDSMPFSGHHKVAERLKAANPAAKDPNDQGPDVHQMQAQMQQASQMLQLMAKELEAKNKIIETETVKFQQQLALKKIDLEIAQMKAQADLAVQLEKIQASNAQAIFDAEVQRLQQIVDQQHEHIQAEMDRQAQQQSQQQDQQHDAGMQASDQAHEADLTAQGQQHEVAMTGAQQAHEAEMAQQQAQQPQAGA